MTPARLSQALQRAGPPRTAAAPLRDEIGRAVRGLQPGARAPGAPGRRAARRARAGRACGARPRCGAGTPVAFYGFDDLTPLQLDAIETLGRVVGAAVTVSLTYEPGRVAFAGRAATFAALAAARRRAPPARGPRATTTSPRRARCRSAISSAGCSSPAAREWIRRERGAPARGRRRARRARAGRAGDLASCCARAWPAEEIARGHARARRRAPSCSEEVFAAAGIPFALQRRRRLGDTRDRPRADRPAALPARGAGGEAAAGRARRPARLAARAGSARAPRSSPTRSRSSAARGRASAPRRRARCGRSATGRWRRSTSSRGPQSAGPAALIERATRELEWLFARAAARRGRGARRGRARRGARPVGGRSARWPSCASWRGPRPSSRRRTGRRWRGRLERVRGVQRAAARPRERWRCSTRSRCARAACGRCSCAACRRASSRPAPRAAAAARRGGAPQARGNLRAAPRRARGPLTERQLAAERYLLYAAVSRPEELLVLSWHVADDDGDPDGAVAVRGGRLRPVRGAAARGAPAPAARGGRAGERPLSRRAPATPGAGGGIGRARAERRAGARAAARAAVVGILARELDRLPDALVRRANCCARAPSIPTPSRCAAGGLAHAALKDTLEGLRARRARRAVDAPQGWSSRASCCGAALERNEPDHPLSVSPERRPGVRRRLRADLERYLEHAAEVEDPARAQVPRGRLRDRRGRRQGTRRAPCRRSSSATASRLRGRIDRVDVSAAGEAVVVRLQEQLRARARASGSARARLQVALYMRAVEELLGLQVVGGFYQPLSGADLRAARPARQRQRRASSTCVSGDERDTARCASCSDEALAMARAAVAEARRGEIEARPETCAFGRAAASYPPICRCER